MSKLIEFVQSHIERGECKCGLCCDSGDKSGPQGHVADLIFFKLVKRGDPDAGKFVSMIREHQGGFVDVDLLDGAEHCFMEIGGWIGSQDVALELMGLGYLLGVFELLTPNLLPGLDDDTKMSLAMSGLVSIKSRKEYVL